MKILIAFLLPALIIISSCKEKKPLKEKEIDAERGITKLDRDDPEFLRLKDSAQLHLPEFIQQLNDHSGDTNYLFIIKSDFADGELHEHMWSRPFLFSNNYFSAVFSDSAYDVKNVQPGDTVRIRKEDVEDWSIFDGVHQERKGYFSEKYLTEEE